MKEPGYSLFDTSIGRCGLAWGANGVRGVQLPELTPHQTAARLQSRFPDLSELTPRADMKKATEAIVGLLDGRSRDLSTIPLDMSDCSEFSRRVYQHAREIPRGQTLSYGELARNVGNGKAMRAVGRSLGANPIPIIIPCHRVLAAATGGGGFSASGGLTTKSCMLRIEGVQDVSFPGFDYDPFVAAQTLREADAKLGKVIAQIGPPKFQMSVTTSVFVALARAIVYQQLSGKAAGTIFSRLCALFPGGERGLSAEGLVPLSHAELRAAGLSNNKVLALQDLAAKTISGVVPTLRRLRTMDDEQIIEALTSVRGIGRWTVEMMLMFRLGRADVLAVDDLGLRQGHAIIVGRQGETERKKLAVYAERWRPYRSVASWYLWRAVDLKRGV
jgi:O-6-methylguanine DNA methyltransferase